ncbi:MAG: aldehyde dehydrogenase, partial [Aquiluna sp.]
MDVNAVDLEGTSNATELQISAANTVKRVIRPNTYPRTGSKGNLQHILDLMEVKTVWHPKGH